MNTVNEEIFEVDNSEPDEKAIYNAGLFNPTLNVKEIVIFPKNKKQPEMAAFDAHHKDMIEFCKSALYHLKQWEKLFKQQEQIWTESSMKDIKKSKKYSGTTKITPQDIFNDYRRCLNDCLNGWQHHHKMPKGIIDRYNKVLKEGMTRMNVGDSFSDVKVKWHRKNPKVLQTNIIQETENG